MLRLIKQMRRGSDKELANSTWQSGSFNPETHKFIRLSIHFVGEHQISAYKVEIGPNEARALRDYLNRCTNEDAL